MAAQPYYAVIFDAGSTGTRPYIYRITPKGVVDDHGNVPPGQVVEILKPGSKPLNKSPEGGEGAGGIHKQTAETLAAHLDPPFNDVVWVLERVITLRAPVKYYLLPTGGVRDNLSPGDKVRLTGWVTDYIAQRQITPGDFEYRAISGVEEAKFGWVAAHRSLGRDYKDGYVEMGGQTAQIAFPVPDAHHDTAQGVVAGLNRPTDVVELVNVGPRRLFLASYKLGSDAGYKAYIQALFTKRGDNRLQLNGGVEGDRTVLYDPSKRVGYPETETETETTEGIQQIRIRSMPDGDWHGKPKLGMTLLLAEIALQALFSDAAITTVLDEPVISKLDFIGASNFWYSMCGALNPDSEQALNLKAFQTNTREKSKMTHTQFRAMHESLGTKEHLLPIYDKSTFTDRWTLNVLRRAFGLGLSLGPNEAGKNMTFTPYNGSGSDKNRFSWTLGKAVLLASPDLNDLRPAPLRAHAVPLLALGTVA